MQITLIRRIFPLFACLALLTAGDARRIRTRPRPVQQPAPQHVQQESEDIPESELTSEEDSRAQSAIQYYDTEPRDNLQDDRVVLISSNDDYNGLYGQPTIRSRADRPAPQAFRSTTIAPRTKDQGTKSPPVQTIRNYSKVNDDGSFTFGYEAADGSFKEETRGTDCVVRGKYGYIDPDGNKREFTYVSGNPCDPNNPESRESEEERDRDTSVEEPNEPENIPNYPKQRPVRPIPTRPIHTTTHAPTTLFQNNYAQHTLPEETEEEEPEPIQVLQPQRPRVSPTVQPLAFQPKVPTEVAIRQRPRITIQTTPSPVSVYTPAPQSVSITPRPQVYRAPVQTIPTQPPATTYRPAIKITQTPAAISYKATPRPSYYSTPLQNTIPSTTRRPLDFAEELAKFHKEHNVNVAPLTTTTAKSTTAPVRQYKIPVPQQPSIPVTSNPIYESQLVFDPSSGQYDSALYQQLPQTDGDFSLNHRIQPYVHPISSTAAPPQLLSIEQLRQSSPLYTRTQPTPVPQFSQQVYENEREQVQVYNSQQLFQQQQELQKQQLQQDRIEAARKAASQQQRQQVQQVQQVQQTHQVQQPQTQHRFQPAPQIHRPTIPEAPQGFYYIQPSAGGQIDAFLRGHNIDF